MPPIVEKWPLERLDTLARIDPDSLGSDTPSDFEFYYLDITSISDGLLSVPKQKTVFRNAPSRARKRLRPGDVLMSTVRPNLKAFACFDREYGDFVASTGFAVLRPREKADSHFIYHSLFSANIEAQIRQRVVGSNYPAINTNDVVGLLLHTPPKDKRPAIAAILDTVNDTIRQTAAVIEKLTKMKAGLLRDLLTRGIDEDGQLRDPERHPEQFKDSVLGKLPKAWRVVSLGSCGEFCNGLNKARKDFGFGTKFVNIIDVYDERLRVGRLGRMNASVAEAARYRLEAGDILIDRSSVQLDGVGYPTVFEGDVEEVVFWVLEECSG